MRTIASAEANAANLLFEKGNPVNPVQGTTELVDDYQSCAPFASVPSLVQSRLFV